MTRSFVNGLFFFAIAAGSFAHGRGGEHAAGTTATSSPGKPVLGTLTTVEERSIGVRTREGEKVTIALEADLEPLQLERGKESPANRGDLKVGRRVAVSVTKKANQLTATRVVLGIASPPGETGAGETEPAPMDHEKMGHEAMEPARETSDAPALLRVVDAYRAALVERSVEDLGQTVTPDLLVLEGVHKNVGWPDYRDNHIGPEMKEWKRFEVLGAPKTLETRMAGSFGYVVQESAYRVVTADGPIELTSAETFVLRKSAEGWRIRHLHYSGQRKTGAPTDRKP